MLDHSILIWLRLVAGGWKDGNKPLSVTVFALGREVGSPVLFLKFYLFCLGDSHVFGEVVIAGGAFDLQKPDVFLMNLDALHVFCPCGEDETEIGHEIRYVNYYKQSKLSNSLKDKVVI